MRLIIALLLSLACIAPLTAEDVVFYQKETDKFWSVFGEADTETGQVTCYGRANKRDGSFIQIHRSLVDGELWAIIRNTAWEIDGSGRGTLRWNFYSANKDSFIDGTEFTYEIRNKNTILILQINSKRFTEVLWNTRYFTLVMPGNLQNLSVSFERKGSSMLDALAECVAKNEKTYKNFKPSLEKIPEAVKDKI
ncbi:MAG: hypothetical protein AB7I42_19115 [Bradyrhizobium sp.]|uniref:hypothetical protein n=1 Tax=Bradyrhizobium sp. TaxID=376 RepID=UPI003D0AAB56